MKEEKNRVFIEHVADFLEACKNNDAILMDGSAYQEIIRALMAQAEKTSDKGTRKALEKVIAELTQPLKDREPTVPLGKNNDDFVELGGVVHMGESLRDHLLQAIKEGTAGELDSLRSMIPKVAVINNSKLAQNITKDFVGAGEIELDVGTAKKPLTIVASLAYDDPALSITGRQPFTAYDRTVYNGICSLFQAGNKHFTPVMVYRAMNGVTENRYISPQAVGAVTRSIEKLRVTKLTIDCTDQLKAYPKLRQATVDDMLLTVKKVRVLNQNGEIQDAYAFNSIPILYDYSRSIGQVLSIPPRLLNSSKKLNTTEEVIVIREYLIRRIEGMKGKNALKSDRITYAAIYEELGIDQTAITKDKARKIRDNTEKLLGHLQAEGFISGFTEYKSGRTIAGLQISL